MPFMTTEELREQRREYVNSVGLIQVYYCGMDFAAKQRAAKTIANIQHRIDEIDAELKMAGALGRIAAA